jgi:Zn-dependent protease
MRGSWPMGHIAGIRVQMHWTFLILIAWVILEYALQGANSVEVALGVALVLLVFGCVVLHELGHALTARRFGIRTRDITLLPIGGVARLERMPDDPRQELLVAVAGPAVNVVIAGALWVLLRGTGSLPALADATRIGGSLLGTLMYVNILLVGFNLLPAFPMDGGRVLRALLAMRLPYARATRIAANAGAGMAVLFGFAGLIMVNPFLLFIALFVYLGAQSEAQQTISRVALEGLTVRDAMMTRFTTLPENATLGQAAEELLAGAQQDFPVTVDGRLLGILGRSALVVQLRQRGPGATVGEFASSGCDTAAEGEPLEEALARMREGRCNSIPVVRDGKVVGMLTLENVSELLLLSGAGRGSR